MEDNECPKCHGSLAVDYENVDERIYVCQHCGAKFRKNLSKTAINAKVQLEELKHAETLTSMDHQRELDVLDKQYEQEVDRANRDIKSNAIVIISMILMFALLFAVLYAMDYFKNNPGFQLGVKQVQVVKSASDIRGTNHEIVEDELQALGFSEIDAQPLNDMGWLENLNPLVTDGAIDYISINGDSSFKENTWFPADAKIIIKYHSSKQPKDI